MSSKNYCFDNKQFDNKSTLNKLMNKPISDISSTNKLLKDNQNKYSSKNFNGSMNKLMNKPPNLNIYKNSNLEPNKNIDKSKANAYLNNMLEEDLKRAYYEMENTKKSALAKRSNSKHSAYNQCENYCSNINITKEAKINFNQTSIYDQNQCSKDIYNHFDYKNNRNILDKSITFINSKQKDYCSINNNLSKIEEQEINYNQFIETNRDKFNCDNNTNKCLNNTSSNPIIYNKNQKSNLKNFSMYSINNNYFNTIDNKNNNVNVLDKKTYNNNNLTCNNNINRNIKNALNNPTVLNGGFIMAALNKNAVKEDSNNHYNTNTLKYNNSLNNKQFLNNFQYNQKNSDESNVLQTSKQKDLNNFNQNLKNINIGIKNNNISKPSNFIKKNTGNENMFKIHPTQNDCTNRIRMENKQRSESFNKINFMPFSLKYNYKRPKSHTFNEIIPNRENHNVCSKYSSSEKNNNFLALEKKVFNISKDCKTLSIMDLKKRYNEVIKKKKIPTSLIIKSIKSNIGTNVCNKTISDNHKKIPIENDIISKQANHSFFKPIAKNNLYMKKNSFNFSNTNNLKLFELSKTNIYKENDFKTNDEVNNTNNILMKELLEKQDENHFLKISNLTIDSKNKSDLLIAMHPISKDKRTSSINGTLAAKNSEKYSNNKLKLRNRIYNEDKFSKNLFNPIKSSSKKNLLNVKSFKTNNTLNPNGFIDFNTDYENEKKAFNNLDKIVKNEDFINKKLRARNKSFASSNLNWNNLIFTNKSQSIVVNKNNNKIEKISKIKTIDSLLKLQLQGMAMELKNQTTKNANISKKSLDLNAYNKENNSKFVINRHNLNSKSISNHNTNLLVNKNILPGQKKIINKSLVNSELINELQNYVTNKNHDSNNNLNYSKQIDKNNLSTSRIEIDRNKNINNNNKENKVRIKQNPFVKESREINQSLIKGDLINDDEFNDIINSYKEETDSTRNNNNISDQNNNNIRILENDSDIMLNDHNKYYKLNNSVKNEKNINSTTKLNNQLECEKSNSRILNNIINIENEKSDNNNYNNEYIYEENINKFKDKVVDNSIQDSIKNSKESFDKNKSFSNLSKYADDIEDMNTIIKRLDFAKTNKNQDSIFDLNNRTYIEFNLKFKNEIESHLFPYKNNQINSVGKRNDSNSKSHISTEDTSSKKKISPNFCKENIQRDVLDNGREKINLYDVHLSKIK